MSEDILYRRTPSPALLAMRNERKVLAPVRKQISLLQKRVAFVEGRARSTRPTGVEERAAEVGDIRNALTATRVIIDDLMQGVVGVGPADDCRKALVQIEQRLAGL